MVERRSYTTLVGGSSPPQPTHNRQYLYMKIKITKKTIMQAGDEMFWDRMNALSGQAGERYMVVDRNKQVVLVENAKLIKETKKVKI
jgi:hypothetical protein